MLKINRFDKYTDEMKAKGCKDEDILQLRDKFSENIKKIEKSFNKLSKSDDKLNKELSLDDFSQFITNIEEIVESELETLKSYIVAYIDKQEKGFDFSTFYEFVQSWSVSVWEKRNLKIEDSNKNNEKKKQKKQKQNEIKQEAQDKNTVEIVNFGMTSPQSSGFQSELAGKALSVDQKSRSYTFQLLEFKFEHYKIQIDQLLEKYIKNEQFQNINTKKYFDEIFEEYQKVSKLNICYTGDLKKQKKFQSDPDLIKQIKDTFTIIYKDNNGQPFFRPEDFYNGIRLFFKEQSGIKRKISNDQEEFAIIVDQTNDYENFLNIISNSSMTQNNKKKSKVDELLVKDDIEIDPMIQMKEQLYKSKAQYESLLNSGKVKDQARQLSISQMIYSLDAQIKFIDNPMLTSPQASDKMSKYQKNSGLYYDAHASMNSGSPFKQSTLSKRTMPKKLKQEELIELSLNEIFYFYSRQHIQNNLKFEDLQKSFKKMDMGEFSSFCRDFGINLPRQKIGDCFKKVSINNQALEYDNFKQSIGVLAKYYQQALLRENQAKLQEIEKIIQQLQLQEIYNGKQLQSGDFDKQFYDEMTVALQEKTELYLKYVDRNLKINDSLRFQMPNQQAVGIKQKKPKPQIQQKGDVQILDNSKLNKIKLQKIDPYLLKIDRINQIELDHVFDQSTDGVDLKKLEEELNDNTEIFQNAENLKLEETLKKQSKEPQTIVKKVTTQNLDDQHQVSKDKILESKRGTSQNIDDQQQMMSKKGTVLNVNDIKNQSQEEFQNKELSAPKIIENKDEKQKITLKDGKKSSEKHDQLKQEELNQFNNYDLQIEEDEENEEANSEDLSDGEELQGVQIEDSNQIISFSQIYHPLFSKMKEIQEQIQYLEKLESGKDLIDFIQLDVMKLNHQRDYRKRIKGFHLAFNIREKLDQQLNDYKYKPQGTAEEIRLKALNLKNQRLNNQKLRDQMEKEKYKKDRESLRIMHEKMRKNKQIELIEIGNQVLPGENATELMSDPKRYMALRAKQEQLKLQKINEFKNKEKLNQAEFEKQNQEQQKINESEKKDQEIIELMTKKAITFNDIENLSYHQFNKLSQKHGEDLFNPNDILEIQEGISEESEQDEILRKFISKSQTYSRQKKRSVIDENIYQQQPSKMTEQLMLQQSIINDQKQNQYMRQIENINNIQSYREINKPIVGSDSISNQDFERKRKNLQNSPKVQNNLIPKSQRKNGKKDLFDGQNIQKINKDDLRNKRSSGSLQPLQINQDIHAMNNYVTPLGKQVMPMTSKKQGSQPEQFFQMHQLSPFEGNNDNFQRKHSGMKIENTPQNKEVLNSKRLKSENYQGKVNKSSAGHVIGQINIQGMKQNLMISSEEGSQYFTNKNSIVNGLNQQRIQSLINQSTEGKRNQLVKQSPSTMRNKDDQLSQNLKNQNYLRAEKLQQLQDKQQIVQQKVRIMF